MSKLNFSTNDKKVNQALSSDIDQDKLITKLKNNKFLANLIRKHNLNDQEIFTYLPQMLILEQESHKTNLVWQTTIARNHKNKLVFGKQLSATNLTNEFKIKTNILFKDYNTYSNDDLLTKAILSLFQDELDIYEYLTDLYNKKSNLETLYITGSIKSKRSYTLSLIANYYAINDQKVAYLDINLLEDKLKRSFNKSNLDIDSLLEDLVNVDILIFDEIGLKQLSLWFLDSFFLPLLSQRLQNKSKTYFGSYYNFNELGKQLFKKSPSGENIDPKGPLAKKLIYLIDQLSKEKVWIHHE